MSRANKRKGSSFETDVVKYLRARGLIADRLRLAGTDDEGDVAARRHNSEDVFVLECKNSARFTPGEWVKEAEREAAHYNRNRGWPLNSAFPVVVAKRRNHGVADAYVIIPLSDFTDLM